MDNGLSQRSSRKHQEQFESDGQLIAMSTTNAHSIGISPAAPYHQLLASWRQKIIYLGFLGLFAAFSFVLSGQGFLTADNLLNIVRQTTVISIMAVAMTFVLTAGEIDLSVGAVAGLASVTTAMTIGTFGTIPGCLAGVASGLLIGAFNGFLTTRVGIPSFLTTLAMMGIARGIGMWASATASIPVLSDSYVYVFGGGNIGRFPILMIWTLLFGIVGHLALWKTAFGRRVLATGGNVTTARRSGICPRVVKTQVMILSSFTAAIAGMIYTGRLQSGRFQFGEGDELSVIAAAVLGGTSFFGGVGTVVGSIVGALMIGLINNGLILMGLEYSQQLIARGVIIILAVSISQPKRS
jgi:ribose transport system permease protein